MPEHDGAVTADLLTFQETARELRVHPATLRRWVALDEAPPFVQLGRKKLCRVASLRAWLLSRERPAARQAIARNSGKLGPDPSYRPVQFCPATSVQHE